jgi:glutaredoxin
VCPYCKLDITALRNYDFKEQITAKKDSEIEKAIQDRTNQYE